MTGRSFHFVCKPCRQTAKGRRVPVCPRCSRLMLRTNDRVPRKTDDRGWRHLRVWAAALEAPPESLEAPPGPPRKRHPSKRKNAWMDITEVRAVFAAEGLENYCADFALKDHFSATTSRRVLGTQLYYSPKVYDILERAKIDAVRRALEGREP